jgi:hypothetical protein
MTFEQGTGLIREFGFPVFVALWFMIRLERRVDRLSELLTSLMQATAIIAKAVEPRENGSRTTGAFPVIPDQEKS